VSKLDELRKAMLSESDITGKLVQNKINKVIQSLVQVNNPLRQNLPRKPGSGEGSYINQRSANPTTNAVNDTETITPGESTYGTRLSLTFKTLLAAGAVTRKAQAVGRSYTDLKMAETMAAMESVRDKEENLIINGDSSSDAKEYDGLRVFLPTGDAQVVSAGTNGAPLTLDMMDEAIDKVYGMPDMIIASKRSRRQLNALLQAQQQFVNVTEVKGGFKLMSYNGIPIYWSQHISDAQTQGTASNASDIFILDTTKVWMEVLTELSMVPIAKTTSQYDEFHILEDLVLVVANKKYCSRIEGIIPA
jgi:hypothetical protein